MRASLLGIAGVLAFVAPAAAQDFVPGRPGNTESPIAVPSGHLQIETEIASYARSDGADADALSLAQTSFRYGLAPSWEAEAIVAPYNRFAAGGASQSGFGDVTLRLRKTLSGADAPYALGLIGYVTLPTAADGLGADHVEGGVIAAGAFDLSDKVNLTWTGGLGAVSDGDEYDASVSGGAALGYAFSESAGGYIELFGEHVSGETAATLDFGATYLLNGVTQIDAGADIGVSDAADDYRLFVGWARLF
jgi:Putative MetA-pathway of phenol degradation